MNRNELIKILQSNSATKIEHDAVYVASDGCTFYVGDMYEMTEQQLAEAVSVNGFII